MPVIDYGHHSTTNRFRRQRGRILRQQIDRLAHDLGRDIVILDVGGRPDYWGNLGLERIARIDLLNNNDREYGGPRPAGVPEGLFRFLIGDARNLEDFPDGSVDLAHSNSVIEHVGRWGDMVAMAREMRRVGRSGWVQTPASGFPIEPHFHMPFMHWFNAPIRARMLSLSLSRRFRVMGVAKRRRAVESVNLLNHSEVEALFPGCSIETERFMLMPKSYVARWMPDAAAAADRASDEAGRAMERAS
jgi:hypothetical protein